MNTEDAATDGALPRPLWFEPRMIFVCSGRGLSLQWRDGLWLVESTSLNPDPCAVMGRAFIYSLQGRALPEIQPGESSPSETVRLLVRSRLYHKPQRLK
jgi:hypothetical protein